MPYEPIELPEAERRGRGLLGYAWHARTTRWSLFLLCAIVFFCESAWLVYLAPTDIARYECYGLTFWLGSHGATLPALLPGQCTFLKVSTPVSAFHMLPLEYPPLTIAVFSLPLLAPLPYYALSFALIMTLAAVAIYRLLARSDVCRAAPIFLLYLILGTSAVAQERFDLLPAACTLICVLAARRGRWKTAYIALALGVLLKLYPLVMLPSLFLAEQRAWTREHAFPDGHGTWFAQTWVRVKRWRWQNGLLFVVLLVVVMGVFALLNFNEAILSPLQYFLQRPPQIESLAGSIIWLGRYLGAPYSIKFDFGSLNIDSSLTRFISPVDTLLTVVGIFLVLWLQWRQRIDLAQALVGLVCVLIATGKVFSPQYLIWLFPLLAYIFASDKTSRLWMYAWATISLFTTAIYIFYYSRLVDPQTDPQIVQTLPGFFELVALRNLWLLLTVLAFLLNWWGARRGTGSGESHFAAVQ